MRSLQLFLVLTPVACALAQAPPPAPAASQAAPAKAPTISVAPQAQAPAPNVPPDKVVLTIGDEKITAAQFDHFLDTVPEQYRAQMMRPTGRRQFADNIVRIKVMAQEARKRSLDKTEAFKQQMAMQTEQVLAQTLYKDLVATVKPDDAMTKDYYEKHKSEYEQIKARHILIRVKGSPVPARPNTKELTEAEALAKAKEIREQLVKGADFAKLAEKESDDAGSGKQGGELGMFGHGRMVPPFEQAAFSMKIGDISEPVKSQFGYHIIQVEEKHNKTYEEALPEIQKKLGGEAVQKAMEQLKASANVSMDQDFFGPPAPPPAPAKTTATAPAKSTK